MCVWLYFQFLVERLRWRRFCSWGFPQIAIVVCHAVRTLAMHVIEYGCERILLYLPACAQRARSHAFVYDILI